MLEDPFGRSGTAPVFVEAEVWVAAAYVLGMFAILAFRPQRIAKPGAFRRSYLLFVLYLVLPGVCRCAILLSFLETDLSRSTGLAALVVQLVDVIAKALLGFSIASALDSLVGRPRWGHLPPQDAEESV